MFKFAFFLKTYEGDLRYAERLIESFHRHNKDFIHLFLCAPSSDLSLFEAFAGKHVTVMSDESVCSNLVIDESVHGIRPGYVNQEILKLAFWEKGLCENYLCVDSDAEFIRDFKVSDFMYDGDTPFTILVEDHELAVEPEYFLTHWKARETHLRRIQKEVGLPETLRILTSHGLSILSTKVLRSLKEDFMKPRNFTYVDLLKIAPYEFSWYNMWLQKSRVIPIEVREPLFKVFHHKNQHMDYLRKGITLQDISRGYLGVVINSNYSRWHGFVSYDYSKGYEFSMAEVGVLMRQIVASVARKIFRRVWGERGKV